VATAFAEALARFRRKDKLAGLPFFIATEETLSQCGALARVWGPLPKLHRRMTIVELPAKEGLDCDLSDCIGRRFTTDGEQRHARLMPLSRRPHFPVGKLPGDDEEEPPREGVVA
jgi:hypothetical protein